MAEGSSSLKHVRLIVDTVLGLSPRSVVDLGMGTGKYGFLLREQHDLAQVHWGEEPWRLRLVGVEGYAAYVTDLQRAVYDEVHVADARDVLAGTEDRFDVALALDVLEHFTPDDGERFLEAALGRAQHVVVLTPRGYYHQEGHENTLERHLSWWPEPALRGTAKRLGVQLATTHSMDGTIAVLSHGREAQLATDRPWRESLIRVRDRLVPELVWCRLRGKAGPMVAGECRLPRGSRRGRGRRSPHDGPGSRRPARSR
jgi:hypothetical protein